MDLRKKARILDAAKMDRAIHRMAFETIEKHRGIDRLALVGIRTRGVPLAERMARKIRDIEGHLVPVGSIDITLYRDDLSTVAAQPILKRTELPFAIDGLDVFLVDDVLYTGRTVRAAMDALIDYGRPRSIRLAVLIDRGHRELPIHADVVGKSVPTSAREIIKVMFRETDASDEVLIMEGVQGGVQSKGVSPRPAARAGGAKHTAAKAKATAVKPAGKAAAAGVKPAARGARARR